MFIGRESEISVLENTYNKDGFQMTVIYGRRRIGKSYLITEFMKGKKSSYYVASQSSMEDNVRKWSVQLVSDLVPEMEGVAFDDLEAFFRFVGNLAQSERLVLALDEIPYMAEADDSFLSRFQVAIDTILSSKNIYLIICGSAISFMEREVLSEKSPLFGRRTNQIFLKPFDYLDSAKFVPKYGFEEKAIVYGVTGGVAKYLTLFDDNLPLDDNLINNFFKPSGYLYEEPINLLTQEFRTINTYNAVIETCAGGANKMTEIADKAHVSTSALAYVIKSLCTIGVISKVSPMTEKENAKKTAYEISDGMYRFWYSFIPAARASIEMNRGEVFYKNYVKDKLHSFMGSVFEEMCRHYVLSKGLDGRLKCLVTNVGKWWGPGHDRKPTDIDVVGIDHGGRKAVIGECKFKNEVIDKEVYEALMDRRGLIDKRYEEVEYLFFSLSGYSKWVKENAEKGKVLLLTLSDLYDV
ncbi:MAG: ATP-binding protein [Lachnospiraceae bacterium]|nr:ATP-binding protein [Lachnospiraceae bacterium]MBR6150159.1 ATP-binding protein [Lachnospiraceae bacterium]